MFFRLLVWGALVGGVPSVLSAQLLLFSFDGSSGDEEGLSPSSQVDHLTVGPITRGEGLNASSAAGAFGARDWSVGELEADDYFEFSVIPAFGYELSLTSMQLDERRSASGIREWTVRSSLDGFSLDLSPGPLLVGDNTGTRADQQLDFDTETYSHLSEQIAFRIYAYQAESSVGTWRIDNVELFGNLTAVPEPKPMIFGLVMGGMALFLCSFHRISSRTKIDPRERLVTGAKVCLQALLLPFEALNFRRVTSKGAPMKKQCHSCGWEWELTGQPGRSESCPECRADLRVCLNCESYDAHVAHQCRDRRAEPVMEKDRGNYCEYFEMTRRSSENDNGPGESAADRLRKLLGD